VSLSSKFRSLSYMFRRRPLPLERPVVLQFPVIDICNSQCQMCRIWENKKSDDITPEQLRKGLRNPLYARVQAVGLNGGEPTLRKDLGELAAVLFEELPALKHLSLITNAYRDEEVIERIKEVGTVAARHGGKLDVMVSLDGYGEVHDTVRGKPGNFERAQRVIRFARSSPLVTSLRIGCTIIKSNVYGLADLFDYCQREDLYVKFRLGVPHQRLYTQNLLDPYALSADERFHVVEFLEGLLQHYEQGVHQRYFYRSLIDQLVSGAPRKAGCDWKHRGATITSKGELLYCAVQSKPLGLIHQQSSEEIFFGNQGHLLDIVRSKCDTCHHDYVGLPDRRELIRQNMAKLAQRLHLTGVSGALLKAPMIQKARSFRAFRRRLRMFQQIARQIPSTRAPRPPSPPEVLVCGWYGTETLGDKAILGGVIEALQQHLGPCRINVISLHRYVSEVTRRQMPELKGTGILDAREALERLPRADLLVFGGGPLMAIHELAEMQVLFETAKRLGVRTLIAGCGVGPLGLPWHNQALAALLNAADMRIYRDQRSSQVARALGVDTENDLVAEDPAFTWLQKRSTSGLASAPHEGRVLLLGLREFPFVDYAKHLSKQECEQIRTRSEEAIMAALETLIQRHPDLRIRPLPMCTNHFGDDDRWYYRQLLGRSPSVEARLDRSLLHAELDPDTYVEAFKSADVALTMRFHALVFALGLHTPAVAIDYTLGQGKVHSLAQRFGVGCQSLNELTSEFLVEQIERQLSSAEKPGIGFTPAFSAALSQQLDRVGVPRSAKEVQAA